MFIRARFPLMLVVVAVAMTFLFWWPLYRGAGFIGGDLYPYFFPQKAFYADRLKAGEFPLWNDLAGFGYPVLGESQTGAAYPFHLVLYRCLDLNTAYNIEHLLHYVICFVATSLFAKRLGLTEAGACLSALVFTYGWFPPRACLEWAILTGAWLPVALWCVESFLQTRWWRYAIGLSVTLGLQLLAGHYHLAFITQLLVATYTCWRLWVEQRQRREGVCANDEPSWKRVAVGLLLAGIAGAGLASVQLLPTWELKQRSSRVVTGGDYDPAYGHMPPLYVSQLIVPWCWYSLHSIDEDNVVRDIAEFAAPWHWFGPNRDLDQSIQQCRFGALETGTNKVEAHVYCGLVPILMSFIVTMTWFRKSRHRGPLKKGSKRLPTTKNLGEAQESTKPVRIVQQTIWPTPDTTESIMSATTGFWLIAGLLALVYATGCLLPIGRHLPGFSFFRGPGRYGIVTTLAIALLAGQMLSQLAPRIASRFSRTLVLSMIFFSTCGDLWLVSRMVKYTYMVSPPRIAFREASEVRLRLLAELNLPRLLAPGPNVGNLLGVSCVPWYLGIAPAEYVDSEFAMPPIPKPLPNGKPTPGSPELLEWLSRSGVTHVLNFEPLEETSWRVELVWKGIDPFLNRVWGRAEPIHLYRFLTSQSDGESTSFPRRAFLSDGDIPATTSDWKNASAGSRRIKVDTKHDRNELLVLTELAYPGWTVQRDGKPIDAKQLGIFRAVKCPDDGGEFVWTYRPFSVLIGAAISLATMLVLAVVAHVRFWHPNATERLGNRTSK